MNGCQSFLQVVKSTAYRSLSAACYERNGRLNKFSNELGRMDKNDVGLVSVRTQTGGLSNIFKLIKTYNLTASRWVPCISGRYKACRS
jgi:hypothetical protein